MKKGGKIANRPGLTKKKIRGKDGKTRTYWTKDQGTGQRRKRGRVVGISTGVVGGVLSAAALGVYLGIPALGRVSSTVNPEEFIWPDEEGSEERIKAEYDSFRPGDIVERCYYYGGAETYNSHYAVYIGKDPATGEDQIVQSTLTGDLRAEVAPAPLRVRKPPGLQKKASAWRRASIPGGEGGESTVSPGDLTGKTYTREEIVERARSLVGTPIDYDVINSNCEHIARAIVEGRAYSTQIEGLSEVGRIAAFGANRVVRSVLKRTNAVDAKNIQVLLDIFTQKNRAAKTDSRDTPLPSPEEMSRILDGFTGQHGKELKIALIKEWLVSLYTSGGRTDRAFVAGGIFREGEGMEREYRFSGRNDSVFLACAQIRSDATGQSIRCGKSYIPKTKKCRVGQRPLPSGSSPSGQVQSQSVDPASSAEGSVLQIANKKGFLGKIAVNKEDFDWPGNGKITPEIEARYSKFKKGDLVENAFLSQGKFVRHYGVYGGKDPTTGKHMVYQVARKSDGSGQVIKKEPMDSPKPIEFSAWRQSSREESSQKSNLRPLSRKEVIQRAEATVGKDFHYNLARSNCEHYARGIVEGRSYSAQMEKVSPLTRIAGEIISVGVRKKIGKNGLTAGEITSLVNQMSQKEGRSLATNPSLFLNGVKRDSKIEPNLFADLKSPEEFERELARRTKGLSASSRQLLEEEAYTNYLMLVTATFASNRQGGSLTSP